MRAHYLQHVPFEGLGSIEPWLRTKRYEITKTQLFESTMFPDAHEVDLLIVLGGPMSVNDEAVFPWLVEEKKFIRRCIETQKSVLGICLGAQLIANAMGARVYPNYLKEIGWFTVEGVPPLDDQTFCFPPSAEVFHWHGETFDLPFGAHRLARSEGCENQAFQLGRGVIGLQFYLETTPKSAREMVSHCRAELSSRTQVVQQNPPEESVTKFLSRDLTPSTYVQSETAILAAPPETYRAINELMVKVLSFLKNTDV